MLFIIKSMYKDVMNFFHFQCLHTPGLPVSLMCWGHEGWAGPTVPAVYFSGPPTAFCHEVCAVYELKALSAVAGKQHGVG